MQIVTSYSDFKSSYLHRLRLFYLLRPLLKYRKNYKDSPVWQDIKTDKTVCFIDSAGWIFPVDACIVESNILAKKWCKSAKIFDYTKKSLDHTLVIAYCPELLRYCNLEIFNNFLNLWVKDEMLLYFDKRLVQHNYLKFDLKKLVSNRFDIEESNFHNLTKWHVKNIAKNQ